VFDFQGEMMKDFKDSGAGAYYDLIEKRLKDNKGGKGFYVGDKVSHILDPIRCY